MAMFNQIDERGCAKYRRENVLTDKLIQRLELYGTLEGHEDCVNSIEWDYEGSKLCSVGDDCNIILWDPFKKKKLTQFHSSHTENIFSIKFLQHNYENLLVTAAGDYKCILHDLTTHQHLSICDCHNRRLIKLATSIQDPSLYWSAGEDGLVLQTDVREKHVCRQDKYSNVFVNLSKHCGIYAKVISIACNPVRNNLIAIGSNDEFIRLYDRRMIRIIDLKDTCDNLPNDCVTYFTIGQTANGIKKNNLSCSHLAFSQLGDELLANFYTDNIYLFSILNPKKPKIFSTDITNLFDPIDKFVSTEKSNSSKPKRCKYASDLSQYSMNSPCFSDSKSFNKNSNSVRDEPAINPSTSTAHNILNDSINTPQVPSTSRQDEEIENIEMTNWIDHKSMELIKQINEAQKPHLIKLKAKHKIPKKIRPIFKLAHSYMRKQKYSDTIELMNEAISVMPNVSSFYYLRASAYCKRDWVQDIFCALKDLYKSLEIDPNNKESHLKLAHCLYALKYYENAKLCLDYFRQKQSRDTRYKEFKDIEKKIYAALGKVRLNTNKRKFVENEDDRVQSSSSSSPLSSSSSTNSSFLGSSGPSFDIEDHSWSNENSRRDDTSDNDSSDSDSDSFGPIFDSAYYKNMRAKTDKEMQWRANSYDFDQRFYGFCNVSSDLMEANFFGSDGQYIVGGSDDGHFYIWNRQTTNIVNIIRADDCMVNCVQPHYNSCFIATSGFDKNIKLWTPTMNDDELKKMEEHRLKAIRLKTEANQTKKISTSDIHITFFRMPFLGFIESSDSEDDRSAIQDCLLS